MNKIFVMLKKELRETLRDKKSLSMMFIIPLLIPIIVIGMSAIFDYEANRDVKEYNKIGFAYKLSDKEKELAKSFKIEYQEGSLKELEQLFDDKKIDLYLTKENNIYTIHGDSSNTTSYASNLVENYLNNYKAYLQEEYLNNNNIPADEVLNIISVNYDLKAKDDFVVSYMLSYAFMFLIMAVTVSATYPATDATAGEKERGTLETLLTFPINNRDIMMGKFLSISISSMVTGFISLVLTAISIPIANNMFTIYDKNPLKLPFTGLLYIFLVVILCALLVSGLCILVASKCKTFKEAQSALTPITFISFFPAMIASMAGVSNSLIKSAIPFLNFTMIYEDVLDGKNCILNILVMVLSSLVIIYLLVKTNIKKYKSEKVLF